MKVALTIYFDDCSGEAEAVVESKTFRRVSPLMRADVLQDARGMVSRMYEQAARDAFGAASAQRRRTH